MVAILVVVAELVVVLVVPLPICLVVVVVLLVSQAGMEHPLAGCPAPKAAVLVVPVGGG